MRFLLPATFPASSVIGRGMPMGLAVGPADVTGMPLTSVAGLENPQIDVEETVAIPSYSDTISVILPATSEGNSISSIPSLSVGTQAYSPGVMGALAPGEFYFEPSTQTLTVSPATDTAPVVGTSIKYVASQRKTYTVGDRYTGPIPQFFIDWNVRGPVTFSRSFGQSPTGSLTFEIATSDWKTRRCDLVEGTLIFWRGHYYATGPVSTSEDVFNGNTTVTVSLQGANDHKLREQILLRSRTLSLSGGSNTSDKSVTSISITDMFTRGDMDYSGPSVDIKVAKERDLRDSVSGDSLLPYARSVEAFAYLDGEGIEFRTWHTGRKIHNISSTEIIGYASGSPAPIDISHNNQGSKVDDYFLAAEYKNTRLELDESEGAESGDGGRTNTRQVKKRGDRQIGIAPSNVDRSQHSAHFDQGGPTKECLTETYQNKQLVSSEFEKYGYVYKTSEFGTWVETDGVTSPVFLDPSQQSRSQGWQRVESHSLEVTRDANGYPTKEVKTFELERRFKQESDRRETLYLYAVSQFGTADNPATQANIRAAYDAALGLYDTFPVIEEEITEYEYGDLDDYYPDLPELDDGEPPRLFVERVTTTRRYYYSSSDLEAIQVDDDGTPIVGRDRFFAGGSQAFGIDLDGLTVKTGVDYERVVEYEIIYPPKGLSKAAYNSADDHYIKRERLKNATGQGLRNVYEEPAKEEDHYDKVPGAQRLEIFEEGNSPTVEEDDNDEKTTLLNTDNNGLSPTTDPIEGSVSFPGAYKKSTALAAAKVDISILNTQNVELWANIILPPNREYDVGDILRIDGREGIVLGVEETPLVETADAIQFGEQLVTWGRYIAPNVTSTEVD